MQTVFSWESGRTHPRRMHMNAVHGYLLSQGAISSEVTTGMLFDLVPRSGEDAPPPEKKGRGTIQHGASSDALPAKGDHTWK